MTEKLGEAILELRTDDSGLAAGMAKAKAGAQDMDRSFASAGANVERSMVRVASSSKASGVAASELAVAAQTSARAAMDQASGFGAAASAARVNTLAMRESLVVARELARGNFTRLPGSLSLLAQGIGSQGGIGVFASAIAQQIGLIKQVQNAELAEAATAAANAAAGVESAARLAAAKVMVADTEIALAEAQVRVTTGTAAEAAAQARLVAAHEAVAAASAEAAIAEDALAVAMGRASEAGAASAAATRTMIGGTGIGLIGIGVVAGVAYGAIKQFQDQVKDDGTLDAYADKLNLTDAQIKNLGGSVTYLGHNIREVHGLTVSFGDVMYGVWHEIAREVSDPGPWNALQSNALSAFNTILSGWNKVSAGISAGFRFIAQFGEASWGTLHGGGMPVPGLGDLKKFYADELKRNADAFGGIQAAAIAHRESTLKALSDGNNPRADRHARKQGDHGLQEALDKLDAEIKGQYALAAAYGVSAAAAQRAEAQQKAAEDAIAHKGNADQFYALELQKSVATDAARQAKSNAGLDLENSLRARLNAEVMAGTTSIAGYNDNLKLQTTLNALNADLENADIAHKQVLRDLIKQTIDLNTEQLQLAAQLNALTQEASNDDEIARMQLENSLLGASNKERAVALAQLEAMQKLKQIDPNGLLTQGQRQAFVKSFTDKANASVLSPFQEWAKSVPGDAAAINDALESIAVKGFDGLASAIAGVLTGTESLKDAFHNVAASILSDLIQMTIRMLILKALTAAFGGSFGGAGGGSAGAGVDIGGGTSSFFASNPFGGYSGGHALGGLIPTGTWGTVGEKGPEPVISTPRGAMVLPNSSMRAGNSPANDRMVFAPVFHNDFRGADAQSVSAIAARQDEFERQLPSQVVKVMAEARGRFIWR